MDEYPDRDSLPNKFFHNKLPICGRIAGWGTRDPRPDLGFFCLVGSRMVLIWWAVLSFMRRARRWACAGAGPIE